MADGMRCDVQALLTAVEDVSSWKAPLQSSVDLVDAELAELALSVPLAQVCSSSLPCDVISTSLTTCFGQYIGGFQAALLLQADAAQCLVCQQVWVQRLCYRWEEDLQAFARSLHSVQGFRSGKMVRCTVSGRLQARGPGCLPDVAVTVQLRNEGPYPISKSWVAILECKPSHEGGLSSPKLFIACTP